MDYGENVEQTNKTSNEPRMAQAYGLKYGENVKQANKTSYEPRMAQTDGLKYEENIEQANKTSYEAQIAQMGEIKYGENVEQTNKTSYEPKMAQADGLKYGENIEQANKTSYEAQTAQMGEIKYEENANQTIKNNYEATIDQITEQNYKENAVKDIKSDNEVSSAQIKEVGSVQESTANIVNVKQEPLKKYIIDYKQENTTNDQKNNFEEMYATIFGTKLKGTKEFQVKEEPETYIIPQTQEIANENLSLFKPTGENSTAKYKYIGTAFNNFILIELDKELYILDQKAAYEKIIYEELKQKYENKEEKDTQIMLLPDVINLTEKQMLVVEDNKDIFEKAGFILEQFGQNTIKLTGAPNICMKLDTEKLFLQILEQINKVARTDRQQIEEKMLTTIASVVAQESASVNTPESVEQIMKELIKQPNDSSTGVEKQVFMKLTKADIEKKFSRR